jgi:nicotinamidase-related amidase
MAKPPQLDLPHAQLLVVDLQEKLLPRIVEHERLTRQIVKLLKAATTLDLDVTVTEQYPDGLGRTVPPIEELCGQVAHFEKTVFSACGDEEIERHLLKHMRPHVLIAGVETHVCVQQTALDLLAMQMQPVVLADAVGARHTLDHQVALDHLRASGATVTTVESAIFALVHDADTEVFRKILPIVK